MKTLAALVLSLGLLCGTAACSKSTPAEGAAPTKAAPTKAAAPAKGAQQYYCPMDKEVVSDKPGTCPKCGMKLEPKPAT